MSCLLSALSFVAYSSLSHEEDEELELDDDELEDEFDHAAASLESVSSLLLLSSIEEMICFIAGAYAFLTALLFEAIFFHELGS